MSEESLCLRFANTVSWHAGAHSVDQLQYYTDLVAWAQRRKLVGRQRARVLLKAAEGQPTPARNTLQAARGLREVIYRIFVASTRGRNPTESDLLALNEAARGALACRRLVYAEGGFRWRWAAHSGDLDQMMWPVVQSAVDLLSSHRIRRVKQCADDRGCGWLFVDLSKNHSRRWCSMSDCGNRAKAQRHYRRQRARRA